MNILFLTAALAANPSPAESPLQADFHKISKSFDGEAGVCAMPDLTQPPICVNGDKKFPLQSVMKFIVSAAVLNAVDQKKLKWKETITLKPEDRSPGPQEFYDLIVAKGEYQASIEELVRRSIIDSDSTAVDALIRKLGGISAIQKFLADKKVEGIRIDRDERTLQSEFYGLTWRPNYSNSEAFEAAIRAVPRDKRLAALEKYLQDPRDTATPEGMVMFLNRLFTTKILSRASTERLLYIMEKTATGKNRLRAGIPKNWSIGHKTGTSASYDGRTATTNDVGVLNTPEGQLIPVAVFLSNSKETDERRGAVMAKVSRSVADWYLKSLKDVSKTN